MTIPKEILEKAIAGGWQKKIGTDGRPYIITETNSSSGAWYLTDAEIALDPTFWSALGKSLGWGHDEEGEAPVWHVMAMDFYDLILTGQPTDAFWQELLS